MLHDLHHTLLNPDELHTLAARILQIADGVIGEDEYPRSLHDKLGKQVTKFQQAISHEQASALTPELAERDEERDEAFLAFRDIVKGYTRFHDKSKAAAAQEIENLIKERDWSLYRLGYTQESSQLDILLRELANPEMFKHVEELNLRDFYDELLNRHKKFEEVYQERLKEDAADEYPGLVRAKQEIARLMQGMITYLDISADIDPDRFKTASEKVDEAILEITARARARQTRRENEEEVSVNAGADPDAPVDQDVI